MTEEKTYPMTIEGKEKLEAELDELVTVKRKEVVERIKIARSFGDLSENSEYESAKDEQAFIEGRINTIQHMLQNVEIIDNSGGNEQVRLGSTVTFKELPDGSEDTVTIVGKAESDPFEGKISNETPIAIGLLNKKVGEEVTIETPAGTMTVEVVEIK